jgi:uncharacterized protein
VLFDDESLSLVEVDATTARLLLEPYPEQRHALESRASGDTALAASLDVVRGLEKVGVRQGKTLAPTPEPILANLVLNVTHGCNMACRYCFAGDGTYGTRSSLMTREVAERTVDLLAMTPYDQPKGLLLFGGEPLLNPEVVTSAVTYARQCIGDSSKLEISISTNGTMLSPELADFLVSNKVSIQISMDGMSRLQNQLRPLKNSGDSFQATMANVTPLLEAGRHVHVRASATNLCSDPVNLTAQLLGLGFKSVSIQPVQGGCLEPSHEDMRTMAEGYVTLLRSGLEARIPYLRTLLDRVRKRSITKTFCGAGFRGTTVAPDGTFYICHRFAGVEEFRVGDVHRGFSPDRVRTILGARQSVDDLLVCSVCVFRNLCGGGCAGENFYANGNVAVPWEKRCLMTRAVARAAIDYVLEEITAASAVATASPIGGEANG